jgi:hypothetical protein
MSQLGATAFAVRDADPDISALYLAPKPYVNNAYNLHKVDKHLLPYIQLNSHARPSIIARDVGFDSGVPKAIRGHCSAIAVLPGLSRGLTILYQALHGFIVSMDQAH